MDALLVTGYFGGYGGDLERDVAAALARASVGRAARRPLSLPRLRGGRRPAGRRRARLPGDRDGRSGARGARAAVGARASGAWRLRRAGRGGLLLEPRARRVGRDPARGGPRRADQSPRRSSQRPSSCYPVALKDLRREHKSDEGGVVLGIADPAELEAAFGAARRLVGRADGAASRRDRADRRRPPRPEVRPAPAGRARRRLRRGARRRCGGARARRSRRGRGASPLASLAPRFSPVRAAGRRSTFLPRRRPPRRFRGSQLRLRGSRSSRSTRCSSHPRGLRPRRPAYQAGWSGNERRAPRREPGLRTIQSVDRAAALLKAVANSREPLTVAELAAQCRAQPQHGVAAARDARQPGPRRARSRVAALQRRLRDLSDRSCRRSRRVRPPRAPGAAEARERHR